MASVDTYSGQTRPDIPAIKNRMRICAIICMATILAACGAKDTSTATPENVYYKFGPHYFTQTEQRDMGKQIFNSIYMMGACLSAGTRRASYETKQDAIEWAARPYIAFGMSEDIARQLASSTMNMGMTDGRYPNGRKPDSRECSEEANSARARFVRTFQERSDDYIEAIAESEPIELLGPEGFDELLNSRL